MKIRYSLAPQMRDYDALGQVWLPYLMYFQRPRYTSAAVNTDSRGFRVSYKQDQAFGDFAGIEGFSKCVLLGGSFVFGVGATHDRKTISSQLNALTNELWLNFGGRAYTSTQEYLLFLMHYQKLNKIKKIVIVSGINDLFSFFLSKQYHPDLGTFFFQNQLNESLNASLLPLKRKILKTALYPIFKNNIDYANVTKKDVFSYFLGQNKNLSLACKDFQGFQGESKNRADLATVLTRDLVNWQMLADAIGAKVYYILEPFANWTQQKLAAQEEKLFAELERSRPGQWNILKNIDRAQYLWLKDGLKTICVNLSINFFDLNEVIAPQFDNKWIYIDRVHLTDDGYAFIAGQLNKWVA